MSAEELLCHVDDQDCLLGARTRRELHACQLCHRAVHMLVFNAAGDIFLQRRSQAKDVCPGLWDSSAAGHVLWGESYAVSAERELLEELGCVPQQPMLPLFKLQACAETGWEFVWVYRCQAEGPFVLEPDEIDEGRWFSPQALSDSLLSQPASYTTTLRRIWTRLAVGTSDTASIHPED